MSLTRKFLRRQTAASRRKFSRFVRFRDRAQTMKQGIIALARKRRRDDRRDETRKEREAQWRWLR